MKRKNFTRNALVTSILSLLLCVSMLVGTTFAWFTDEVVTGMNTIAAGNLDVELLADGKEVDSNTKLFDDVALWEPGVVVYENLQVANVGNLALEYQMTLNIGDENTTSAGHKLSEVLKVAYLDKKIEAGATRAEVLAAAKKALDTDETVQGRGKGALSNFYLTGEVEAGVTEDAHAVVIFWDPSDNATDNLYNVNNGQVTSDGEPLHITFGVTLKATQLMHEKDSFGEDYDKFASILPKATVNSLGAQSVPVFGSSEELLLDASFQFLPNESLEQAVASEYKDWHADYVVKADSNVAKDTMALAGYYKAWCQDNGWVVLPVNENVPADTEVRLVELLGTTVSYKEICELGNDKIGFLCGLTDLTGANRGTTVTVQLRMYETDASLGALSSFDSETGHYEVIGEYSYTFGGSWVTLEDGTVLFYTNNDTDDVILYDTQNVNTVDYVVPADVTHIGNYAFSYTDTIETVTMGPNVRDLGRGFDSNGSIKKVVLNEGLETISSRAFRSTTALEEVVISSTVKTIADNAFQKSYIKNIVIPATVETVGETAFGASKIETVTFEGNTSVQGYAFRGCPNLRTVTMLGEDNTFIPSTLNGRNSTWFCNSESNNPNTSNISFYVQNEVVAARVKAAMGAEANNTPVYINGKEAVIKNVKNATELQKALNEAVDGEIIAFAADITGNATVTQKTDIDIVINGMGKKFNGVMTVFGNGRQTGAESLVIKNVNFVAANGAESCIYSPDRSEQTPPTYSYSHNITVEGCTFTDPDGDVNCAAIRHGDGGDKNWNVVDCTVDNTMHSLLQINNVAGKLTITDCKVYSKNGANLNSCTNVEMTGCTFDVKGYAVRFGVSSGGNPGEAKNFVLSNNTLKSACDDGDAVIMFRASAVNATLTLTGNTITGTTEISGNTAATTIIRN